MSRDNGNYITYDEIVVSIEAPRTLSHEDRAAVRFVCDRLPGVIKATVKHLLKGAPIEKKVKVRIE